MEFKRGQIGVLSWSASFHFEDSFSVAMTFQRNRMLFAGMWDVEDTSMFVVLFFGVLALSSFDLSVVHLALSGSTVRGVNMFAN